MYEGYQYLNIVDIKSWSHPMENLSLLAIIRELECELHQPECRRDRERLAQLLAPDFMEFGRSGATYTRDYELMSLPSDPEPPQIHAQDFAVNQLSDSIFQS
jgi:hypothetical protein